MTSLPMQEGHGRRGKLATGDEWETFSRKARRLHSCFQNAGYAKAVKRRFNRKQRQKARAELRKEY